MEWVKVKREGGKGYRMIPADTFDPAIHERFEAPQQPAPTERKPRKQKNGTR